MAQAVGVGADFTSDLEKDNITFKFGGSQVGKVGLGSSSNSLKVEGSDSSTRLDIQNAGVINCTEVQAVSDASLKTEVSRIHESPLDIVKRLRGCKFEWKDAEARRRYGTQVGVLAQECEQAGIPEVVCTDPETGKKSVRYDRLCALLIEAIKQMCGEHDERWQT
jgi:hypothetical protein